MHLTFLLPGESGLIVQPFCERFCRLIQREAQTRLEVFRQSLKPVNPTNEIGKFPDCDLTRPVLRAASFFGSKNPTKKRIKS